MVVPEGLEGLAKVPERPVRNPVKRTLIARGFVGFPVDHGTGRKIPGIGTVEITTA
jgi:hypothetical protein